MVNNYIKVWRPVSQVPLKIEQHFFPFDDTNEILTKAALDRALKFKIEDNAFRVCVMNRTFLTLGCELIGETASD